MGFSFVYCVVCGCPFDIPPANETLADDSWKSDDPLEDKTKQWMCSIRLIGTTACLERFATPPFRMPKNESTIEGFFVSQPADWSITDGFYFRLAQDPFRVLASAEDSGDVLFPLHDNCLKILQRAIAWRVGLTPEPGPPLPSLVSVYKALCAQYARNVAESSRLAKETGFYGSSDYMDYGLEFEHKYYGAREFWASEGWMPTRLNEWYCDNPIDIQDLVPFISAQLYEIQSEPEPAVGNAEERPDTSADAVVSTIKTTSRSRLEALPLEIRDLIVTFLPTTSSILQLRQCCKAFASRIKIDQQFWLTQLQQGRAISYVWDLDGLDEAVENRVYPMTPIESSRRDWKDLAQRLARRGIVVNVDREPTVSDFWGLRNRGRIFTLAEDLLSLSVE